MISEAQIRAARALINWTQGELAKACKLSLRTLNAIESGASIARHANLQTIQAVLESEGVEFTVNDGVRRRTEQMDIVKFEGVGHLDKHLHDVMAHIRTPGDEVLFQLNSEKDFLALQTHVLDDYFRHIHRHGVTERLLITTDDNHVFGHPASYRWQKPDLLGQVSYIVYGDNVAFHVFSKPHRTIIIRSPGIADMFRRQFEHNWKTAETPWFARLYKSADPKEPWTMAKAATAREWIENYAKDRLD